MALAMRQEEEQYSLHVPPAVLQVSEVKPDKCRNQGWYPGLRPKASQRMGNYTLVECIDGKFEGEYWVAESDDGANVTIKILKPRRLPPVWGPPPSAQYECLFGQKAAGRDPHFVNCLDAGSDAGGSGHTGYEFVVMECANGTPYQDLVWRKLKSVVSVWVQLVGACRAGVTTDSGDQLKLIYPIQAWNVFVDDSSGVKIIGYGETRICCTGHRGGEQDQPPQPQDQPCQAFLRNGTTRTFTMCEEEAKIGRMATTQRRSLSLLASAVLDGKALLKLEQGKAAYETVASKPQDYLVEALKEDLEKEDEAKSGVKAKFQEVFAMMLEPLTEEKAPEPAKLLETCVNAALPDKLGELYNLLST
eukprot:CAMPEP_0171100464 /NCGR_PEP_ID=MMETSP0766_2-20121228/52975_1 /TAXON_ID=439317 /ORGANISM="Gambierdiscus australes, Strain CAWD 149" /LENGTH=360 /DNA_ID=CAMNT_0011560301 /DNA_START=110 /DNA_END=1192 /DNA_ORIENTATION=+